MKLIAITSSGLDDREGNPLLSGLGDDGDIYWLDREVAPYTWRKVNTTVEITTIQEGINAYKNRPER